MVRLLGFRVYMCVLVGVLCAAGAAADTITLDLGLSYSGKSDPEGEAPWLRAEFEDTGTNEVTLTLTSLLQGDDEFITDWFFNFDGGRRDLGKLCFDQIGDSGDPQASVSVGSNRYNRAGAGRFDIRFRFDPKNGKGSNRFEAGDSATFLITSKDEDFDLTAALFDVTSWRGDLFTLAHVQGLEGCDDSVWITVGNTTGGTPPTGGGPNPPGSDPVPEPATVLLLGLGLAAGLAHRRFRG